MRPAARRRRYGDDRRGLRAEPRRRRDGYHRNSFRFFFPNLRGPNALFLFFFFLRTNPLFFFFFKEFFFVQIYVFFF